jgi:biotin-dependent carboxylase-like uncharacterized protein
MNENYLEIIALNGRASIQDLGRLNAQHLGFSASGAADEHAFLYANKLINDFQEQITDSNHNKQQTCAALEITLGQINLRANTSCTIAITGADCNAQINNTPVKNWQCYQLQAGDVIDFAMPKNGLHSYLAVLDGLKLDVNQAAWMGSYAQTENEMALHMSGAKLMVNSKIFFSRQTLSSSNQAKEKIQKSTKPIAPYKPNDPALFYVQQQLTLRFIASALFLQLSAKKQKTLLSNSYTISPDSNRMGYRLVMKEHKTTNILSADLRATATLSKPVTYGMIQLPANEQPIVLMKERQTMGGYPVLGSVIQTDLFRLSQMRPGQTVKFTAINHQQAQQQLQAFYRKF